MNEAASATPQGFNDLQVADIEIERNGITKKFRVRELSGDEATKVLNTQKPNGKRDPEKAKTLDARIVAASVSEVLADGTLRTITFSEAQAMGLALRRELVKKSMEVNGLDDDEEDAKN